MAVEFDVNAVGAARIVATVFPNDRARFIRVIGKGCPPRLPQQRLDLWLSGLAGDHFGKNRCAELPSGAGISRIIAQWPAGPAKQQNATAIAGKNHLAVIAFFAPAAIYQPDPMATLAREEQPLLLSDRFDSRAGRLCLPLDRRNPAILPTQLETGSVNERRICFSQQ